MQNILYFIDQVVGLFLAQEYTKINNYRKKMQ